MKIIGVFIGLFVMILGFTMLKPGNDSDNGQPLVTFIIAVGSTIIIFAIIFGE